MTGKDIYLITKREEPKMEEKKTEGRYPWEDTMDNMQKEKIMELILRALTDIFDLADLIGEDELANSIHDVRAKAYDILYPPEDETRDIYLP